MVPRALLVTALVFLAGAVSGEDLVCTSDFETIISSDCKTLHRCVWGEPVRMPDCSPGLIYSRQFGVCVYEGSEFDDCETQKVTEDPCNSQPCNHGGGCKTSEDGKSFTCLCPAEYGGPTCEKDSIQTGCSIVIKNKYATKKNKPSSRNTINCLKTKET